MSFSKHKYKPSYDFPEEILSEIFKRLPVKYVLRCRAVQKSWYSLIKTPMFISLHSNHQILTAHMNPKYLLFTDTITNYYTVRSDDSECRKYCTFHSSFDVPNKSWYEDANGLFCLSTMLNEELDYNCDIYLWNPLVGKSRIIPDTPLSRFSYKEIKWNGLAFGFLPEVNDYVVVHIVKPKSTAEPEPFPLDYFKYDDNRNPYFRYPHSVKIGVYSLNTNSWKEISQDKVFVDKMCSYESVFVNGTAFWIGFSYNEACQVVMYFDTKTNVLGHVEVPSWVARHKRQLWNPVIFSFGQSLAYFVEGDVDDWDDEDDWDEDFRTSHLDMWVLNGERINEYSWKKKMSVKLRENVCVEVLGTRNNGAPIQAKSNNLISYDLDTHEPYDFVESCDRLTPFYYLREGSKSPFLIRPFVETLALLDIANKPSYDFPEEILSLIFKRLPVKYVLHCGAVQKSWYSLIKTPMFISLHFNHQKLTADTNPKYLLFNDTITNLYTVRSDDSECRKYCTFHYPFELPNKAWYGQANGLFCVSTMFSKELGYNPDIYLWNPLVSKFRIIPGSPLPRFKYKEIRWTALAFGFLPEVDDYVVVHVVKPSSTAEPDSPDADYYAFNPYDNPYAHYPHSVKIGVYSLNTNSWKEICQDNVFVDYMSTNESEFVNGTAFWVGYNSDLSEQVVMYFDTKTNVLGQISVPNWVVRHTRQLESPVILPFGQSIAYFVEGDVDDWDDDDDEDDDFGTSHLDIWVLNDERRVLNDKTINEDFWENKMRTYEDAWKKKMSVKLRENVWAEVLGTRNNGAPIQAKSNNLISYDLDTHEPYDFVESCERLTPSYYLKEGSKPPFLIRPFVETLALLDID